MGREIRRVPPNWQHPQEEKYDSFRRVYEMRYKPMKNFSAEEAWADWQKEFAAWLTGGHDLVIAKHGEAEYPKNEPYRSFCKYHGSPPDPEYYLPLWPEGSATWFQVYETVSEGTPVTPPFETEDELIDYLATHGDFWDQKRRQDRNYQFDCGPWKRENAERFVRSGSAPSLVVTTTPEGVTIQQPRDGS